MAKVQRANVILTVKDNEIEYYVGRGFNVIDDSGNIIREAVSNDITALRSMNARKEARIEELTAEIDELKVANEKYLAENADLKAKLKKAEAKLAKVEKAK